MNEIIMKSINYIIGNLKKKTLKIKIPPVGFNFLNNITRNAFVDLTCRSDSCITVIIMQMRIASNRHV